MLVIGLTGGIASGKSSVARMLADHVDEILDADKISKTIMKPGSSIYNKLVERFGSNILIEDRTIDRQELARQVFTDQDDIEFLNSLTHPEIIKIVREKLQLLKEEQGELQIILVLAPLLIEVGLVGDVDFVVLVMADEDIRIKRITRSKGYSENEARQIMDAQLTDREKVKSADFVVENNGTLQDLKEKVNLLVGEIERRKATNHS